MPILLNALADTITAAACLAAGLALVAALRGAAPGRRGWWGQIILLLLLAGWLLHLASAAWPGAWLTLAAGLAYLGAAACIWPFLDQLAAQSADAALQSMKQRVDLAETAVQESRHWLELAERIAHVGHWRYNVAAAVLSWSDEVYHIFGVSKSAFTPDRVGLLDLICPDDRALLQASFEAAIARRQPYEITIRLRRPDRTERHITARGVPDLDAAGNVPSVFGVFVDITEQRRIEAELRAANEASAQAYRALQELAMQDGLTGLPNRRQFDASIAVEFKRAARDKAPLGLIMVDLDHFKGFNDRYGHPAGDTCLRKVAEAIAGVPQRPADLVARYGGEELVVLLPNTDLAGTCAVAALIIDAVRKLKLAHETNPGSIVTVSCGAACFRPALDPQVATMLLERADKALYLAKRGGRDRVVSLAEAA